MTVSRRDWLKTAGQLTLAAGLFGNRQTTAQEQASSQASAGGPDIAVFTKSFQDWSLEKVCQKFAELGLSGLDLTVRPGGHIAPDEITEKLPLADRIARDHGLKIVQITSGVTDADDYAQTLFKTAGTLGIRHIKLGYYRGAKLGQLQQQMQETRTRLNQVVQLAQKHAVMPCVHIHSGNYIPSHGTMLYMLLQEMDPATVGAYVDTLHMSLEGGRSGWRQGLDLLAPWIQLCAVKNYRLTEKKRDQFGQQTWGWETSAIADGVSPIPEFVDTLKRLGYEGPYSLHSEYKPELSTDECYEQTAADLKFFRKLI